jgi:hypothetical protein
MKLPSPAVQLELPALTPLGAQETGVDVSGLHYEVVINPQQSALMLVLYYGTNSLDSETEEYAPNSSKEALLRTLKGMASRISGRVQTAAQLHGDLGLPVRIAHTGGRGI